MVPAPSVKVPRVSTYSGSRCAFSLFPYGAFTLSGWLSQNHSGKIKGSRPRSEPQHARTLVWALSLSLAATQEIDVSFFSSSYLDVSVQRVGSSFDVTGLQPAGLPHSDTCGSSLVCRSPQFFAAYHVLLRLQEPRHPPFALLYFLGLYHTLLLYDTTFFSSLNHVNELFVPRGTRTVLRLRTATPYVILSSNSWKT